MASKKNPDGVKMKRQLPFTLTDADKAKKAEFAAKANEKLIVAIAARKVEVSKHNDKITGLKSEISKHLTMINDGVERREVECVMVKNFEKDEVEFWFEGKMLESRSMTAEERQMDLKIDKNPNAKQPKWQRLGPKHKGKMAASGDVPAEDNPIAEVHRLETSRKTASSAVDPR